MLDRIAFVGTGRMGANMARRSKDCGYQVTAVYDVERSTAAELAKEIGAKAVETLSKLTASADLIFTVVTDDVAQLEVFAESGDTLLACANGKIFVNCATVASKTHVEVERRCRKSGASSLEGCMASSIRQARNRTLYLICGGDRPTFERVKPILENLSSALRYIGPTCQAAQVKALVNMVMNINTAGLAEGLALGSALGLDLNMLREVFSRTGANSQVLETDGEDMQNREHSCYFSATHAAKNSGIAWQLGVDAGLSLPLAKATKDQFDKMVSLGLGQLDKSGVAELTFKGRHA